MALNSTSVIRVVDLLCEGPIAGLVGCDEGIFLEETAIRTGAERNSHLRMSLTILSPAAEHKVSSNKEKTALQRSMM